METQQQFVQYKNLEDGQYAFEVQARNESSHWSEPARLDFVLRPPFWERLWFILFLTLLTVGSAVYFITFRIRQLLAIERLRAHIAADLHDNIGASLTEISIISEVGAKKISQHSPNGTAEHFDNISRISRELVDRMNDIVWLVNPKRDSLYDLIQQLGSSFEEVSTCSGIVFRAHNLESLRQVRLPMDYRQQLYYIFKEALHNSLKHSAAKEIVLEAQTQSKRLFIRLQDDGKGFDKEKQSCRNGLENMKRRAEMIGGKLEVRSAAGKGTTVEFNGKLA
jgi:signal transduction histidine kinase